jgi:hypothetical protein
MKGLPILSLKYAAGDYLTGSKTPVYTTQASVREA